LLNRGVRSFLRGLANSNGIAFAVAISAGALFYFTTKPSHAHFNYTFRVAQALLRGEAGLTEQPGSWLNEFVLANGRYYSVFPLGAVLVNIPAAVGVNFGIVSGWPARGMAAAVAGGCTFFFYGVTRIRPEITTPRRILLALFPIFATWTWCDLGFGGAWQIALGFAVLGQAGALYYTLVERNARLAGLWLAIAIGNRTELLLTLPIYLYFWADQPLRLRNLGNRAQVERLANLLLFPIALVGATAIYNWARFGSPADFGYTRIPGVLKEPWYQHGIFSLGSIRWNAYEMLFRGVGDLPSFPYLKPYGFGCSIFLASPFLFLLFREGGRYRAMCWLTIAVLLLLLWAHGNPGGWQFSYRYAMILLPWMFLLITGNGPVRLSATEVCLWTVAVAINAVATYEFLWTTIITV
jgi:hypothetical protein